MARGDGALVCGAGSPHGPALGGEESGSFASFSSLI